MNGFPAGVSLEVPDGWNCIAFFEPIIQPGLCGYEALTGRVDLGGGRYAARTSPAEVFGMFRVLDFRRYCGLVMDDMRAAAGAAKEP